MPSSLWTGSLSFGLVVIPVRLYPAVRKKVVRFHELDRSGRRIRHVRVSEPEPEWIPPPEIRRETQPDVNERADLPVGRNWSPEPAREVPYDDIRKGFEVAPGQYVSLTREEVAALAPERSRTIDVDQFVEVDAVDPIYFESRYYLAPDREALKSYRLLHAAMSDSGQMAIAWVTLRQRRHLCAIRPHGEVMLLTTMVHADEILPVEFGIPSSEAQPSDRELKAARMLIDALAAPFDPARFEDEHRARLLNAIAQRTPMEQPGVPPSPSKVLDLMAALEASVKAAKAAKATRADSKGKTKSARRREARGA